MALNTTRSTALSLSTPFFLQNFQDMPGNGLAFAIRVGCQDKLGRIACNAIGNLVHALGGFAIDVP